VQLADDFAAIADARSFSKPVDEYNLLYVAATRAKLALVCNQDVQRMLLRAAEQRPVLVEVGASVAAAWSSTRNAKTRRTCVQHLLASSVARGN
jgi:hypothetical protein